MNRPQSSLGRLEPSRAYRRPVLSLCLLAFWGLAAFNPSSAQAADPSKGRALYMTHCQNCHGAKGVGQLPGMPDFAHGEGLFKPDMEVVRVIKSGRGMMPAYQGVFSETQLLDLVAFLRTLR